MIRRFVAAVLIAAGLVLGGGAGVAFGEPDFGAGNSSGGPHDSNSKCHPPGQTEDTPGCK
jgi:hypothetical protein